VGHEHVELVERDAGLPSIRSVGISGRSICSTSLQLWICRMKSYFEPSEPQTMGPMPSLSDGPTTAAPAPSAKMNAVPRSVGSVMSDSRSTPITSTYFALPERTMSAAIPIPWQNPAHAAEMSRAAAGVEPSWSAMRVDTAGVCIRCDTVATSTQSSWAGATSARSRALRAASTLIICTVSCGSAIRRSMMPDRVRIHSSVESMCSQTSAFVTTRLGR
jgi:hypothetical protein